MKIVFLMQSLGIGGAERQRIQLCQALRRKGHDARVYALHTFSEDWRWLCDEETLPVSSLFEHSPSNVAASVAQFVLAIWKLRRIFAAHQTQIATAGNVGVVGAILWLATCRRKRPSSFGRKTVVWA